ncbi:hypothetical protein B0H11DRAFT_1930516 [Mycena galericulata]|nr:hypothetical protein B0H11DRAFT_1930516 [Mycena galericulata]
MADTSPKSDMEPLIPNSLDDLEIRPPLSLAGFMILELVPGLNKNDFIFLRCPWGHFHYFQLQDGEGDTFTIGCWSLRCPGPIGPLARNEGARGQRCPTQYGKFLPKAQARKLLVLRDYFKKQSDVVIAVNKHLKNINSAMATYYGYSEEIPLPLPKEAAAWLSRKLEAARVILENMDTSFIPENPEILDSMDDLPDDLAAARRKPKARADSEDDDEFENYDPDPVEATLPIVAPILGRNVRAIIYSEPDDPAYHAVYCVPNSSRFRWGDYPLPPLMALAQFCYYCVFTEQYLDVPDTIDLARRGKFLIFRKKELRIGQCRWVDRWELRARELAKVEEEEASLPTPSPSMPSSSLPSSSPPEKDTDATSFAKSPAPASALSSDRDAVAPSSNIAVTASASMTGSKTGAAVSSTLARKRQAPEQRRSDIKKQKLDPAPVPASPPPPSLPSPNAPGTAKNPWLVPSSDDAELDVLE